MLIGLIPMSAKPFTKGHHELIKLAAHECDIVEVFVSTSDRYRSGEAPVLGSDMSKIWRDHIVGTLPENARVSYGGSPVGNVLKRLGEAQGNSDTFVVYSDVADAAANFGREVLQKYAGALVSSGRVRVRPVDRSETHEVSGTEMRSYLASGDKASFCGGLPDGMDCDAVWNTLRATVESPPAGLKRTYAKKKQTEALLRRLVRMLVG